MGEKQEPVTWQPREYSLAQGTALSATVSTVQYEEDARRTQVSEPASSTERYEISLKELMKDVLASPTLQQISVSPTYCLLIERGKWDRWNRNSLLTGTS